MKKFRPSVKTMVENLVARKPKVLLWTLWRSGTHWTADMLSDCMGAPTVYKATGKDYVDETFHQIRNYRANTILVRHICMGTDELLCVTAPLGFKVIFVYRDPRDVIASNVNMRKYREGYREGLPPFPDMSLGEILKWELSTLGEHYTKTLPEWAATTDPTVLKLRYEDLIKDPLREMRRVCGFLGLSVSDDKIRRAVEENDFKKVAKRKRGEEDKSAHQRKGIVGDHKNQFTRAEQEEMNRLLGAALEKLGYEA